MTAPHEPEFTLGSEEENADAILREDIQGLRLEKLSHRVTLLTILIPCLIGIILAFVYLDIKDRVTTTRTIGVQDVEKLSEDLESRFSSLSLKQAKLEEKLTAAAAAIDKNAAAVEAKLARTRKEIKTTESAAADKQETAEALAALKGELDALPGRITALKAAIDKTQSAYEKKDADLSTALTRLAGDVKKLKSDIDALAGEKIGTKALAGELEGQRSVYEKQLRQFAIRIEAKIAAIQKRLKDMAKEQASLPPAPAKPAAAAPAPEIEKTPESELKVPEPGKIIEQNLN